MDNSQNTRATVNTRHVLDGLDGGWLMGTSTHYKTTDTSNITGISICSPLQEGMVIYPMTRVTGHQYMPLSSKMEK